MQQHQCSAFCGVISTTWVLYGVRGHKGPLPLGNPQQLLCVNTAGTNLVGPHRLRKKDTACTSTTSPIPSWAPSTYYCFSTLLPTPAFTHAYTRLTWSGGHLLLHWCTRLGSDFPVTAPATNYEAKYFMVLLWHYTWAEYGFCWCTIWLDFGHLFGKFMTVFCAISEARLSNQWCVCMVFNLPGRKKSIPI